MTVLAAQKWNTNAEMIEDCVRLGYLDRMWLTADITYGKGKWWTKFRPLVLKEHDIAIDGVDFRNLPYPDNSFDAVAFDPPYVSMGGRSTSTIPDFLDRYGMVKAPSSPKELQEMINDGLTEIHRVLKPKQYALVKVANYVSSGKLWLGTVHTVNHALSAGFTVFDWLDHIGSQRAQPPGRRQVHARHNSSTLLVLQKGKI